MREQGVKHGYRLEDDKLKVGVLVKGVVMGHTKNAAIISIPGCKYTGLLKADEVNTDGKSMEKAFPLETPIIAKIKHVEKAGNSLQLKLTCRIDDSEVRFLG